MDKPGALADITRVLADLGISIEAMVQKEPSEGEEQVDIIMLTHRALEKNINAAIARIKKLPTDDRQGNAHPAWNNWAANRASTPAKDASLRSRISSRLRKRRSISSCNEGLSGSVTAGRQFLFLVRAFINNLRIPWCRTNALHFHSRRNAAKKVFPNSPGRARARWRACDARNLSENRCGRTGSDGAA